MAWPRRRTGRDISLLYEGVSIVRVKVYGTDAARRAYPVFRIVHIAHVREDAPCCGCIVPSADRDCARIRRDCNGPSEQIARVIERPTAATLQVVLLALT